MNRLRERRGNGESMEPSAGIIYVAFGERYQEEVKRSLRSLRRASRLSAAVITDVAWQDEPQPDAFVIREAIRSLRSRPLYVYADTPFDHTLHLDADTVVGRDPEPLFGLLRHYDFGVRFAGAPLREANGLEYHAQCNGGVFLFRKCPEVEDLFARWLALLDTAIDAAPAGEKSRVNDQRFLARAVAESRARPVHLEAFANFTLFDNIITAAAPIIYHGRQPWLEGMAAHFTRTWNQDDDWHERIWMPNVSGFLPRGLSRSDPLLGLALVLRRAWNEFKWRRRQRDLT